MKEQLLTEVLPSADDSNLLSKITESSRRQDQEISILRPGPQLAELVLGWQIQCQRLDLGTW